ncbi:hypothetical protein BDS110ZK12_53150 [Bradyrhizobium diazoefficiens]|uniref:Uncharacterized protein n=1 Tax=Bradyrhizobium diazoefficiens TaxID=1355477 RepID=A0A810BEM1_9BRAD|nr:hypothetical protein XF8B_47780 [Bradyrhizobium diazoefficiens]
MVVVPPLAHRQQGEQPVVAGIVAGHIPPASVNMCEGVDAECRVIQNHGAPHKSDHEPRPPGNQEAQTREHDRRQQLQPVQPHQLGIRRQIRYLHEVGRIVLPVKDPAEMTVHEALVPG